MKATISLILLLFINCCYGQPDTVVSRLFYGLNPNLPRKELRPMLEADKRFIVIRDTAWSDNFLNIYYGKVQDGGYITTHADSIRLELTFGGGGGITYGYDYAGKRHKYGKKGYIDYSFLKVHYYFQAKDSLERAYARLITYLNFAAIKVVCEDGTITTSYGDTGKSCDVYTYKTNKKRWFRIYKWNLSKRNFSLELEYEREGE